MIILTAIITVTVVAITATVRLVAHDGYRQIPTDRTRLP